MNKYEIQVDGTTFIVDSLGFEYTQLDGDGAGRSDDGSVTRDVIGLTNKLVAKITDKDRYYGSTLSNLLKLIKKKECTLTYFDAMEYQTVNKSMYITVTPVEVRLINNDYYLANEIEIHFIQMDVDNI